MDTLLVLSEQAYEGYVRDVGGLNWQGQPCPKWADLPPKIQHAWKASVIPALRHFQAAIQEMIEAQQEALKEIDAGLKDVLDGFEAK